jgi:hypothetical protein
MVTAPNSFRYFPRFLFLDSSIKGAANVEKSTQVKADGVGDASSLARMGQRVGRV